MKSYEELLAERDALAAQNIKMMQSILYCTIYLGDNKLNSIATGSKAHNMLADAINATPSQCLAEIKAKEAVKGWWACWEWVDSDDKDKPTLIPALSQYEAKVRQGEQPGTWLKDSNVNGGKRQGGEK